MDDETDQVPAETSGERGLEEEAGTAALQVFLRRERLYRRQVGDRYDGHAYPWALD